MGMKTELCPNPEKLGRELKLVVCPQKLRRFEKRDRLPGMIKHGPYALRRKYESRARPAGG